MSGLSWKRCCEVALSKNRQTRQAYPEVQKYNPTDRSGTDERLRKYSHRERRRVIDMVVSGNYQDHALIEKNAITAFGGFEVIFERLGVKLYDDNIDSNL